ncbi:hypothetical protein CR513_19777, partial [Mucuna pruriens]
MSGNKGSTQMWVNQTTSDKENAIECPSTLRLNRDIQAFSKEEMNCLRALLNSTSKPLDSCALTMKERKNRHLLEVAIALLFQTPVPNGESYLEFEFVIESLPFPTQDVQVQEVMKPTLILQQVQLSELDSDSDRPLN